MICYLDFGMMGTVDRSTREDFTEIVIGYVNRDESRTTQALLKVVEWEVEPDRNPWKGIWPISWRCTFISR